MVRCADASSRESQIFHFIPQRFYFGNRTSDENSFENEVKENGASFENKIKESETSKTKKVENIVSEISSIVDTAQSKCYDESTEIVCPKSGRSFFGLLEMCS